LEEGSVSALTVIIVNWNTAAMLRRCLDSIRAETVANMVQLEVIVVDNGSSDGSQTMLRQEYPEVIVLQNATNVGFARANNQGATRASAPVLLLLNSDAALCSGATSAVLSYLHEQPAIGIVGLQLLNDDGTLQRSGKRFPTLLTTTIALLPLPEAWRHAYDARRNRRDYGSIAVVDEVSGAAMAVRTALFQRLSGFDERFYFLGEDVDLCIRAACAGSRVAYLPAAKALHSWGSARSKTPLLRQGLLSQRAYLLLLLRHKPRWQGELLRLLLILLTTLRLLRALLQLWRHPSPVARQRTHLCAREIQWLCRAHP